MNERNLIPGAHALTVEEQSSGGKASGKARRKKQSMKQCMEMLLALPASADDYEILSAVNTAFAELDDSEITNMLVVNAALLKAAKAGDVAAVKELRSIIRDDERLKIEKSRLNIERERLKSEKQRGSDGDAAVMERLDEVLSKIGE